LKSKIISHILQPLTFRQEISLASLPISLHTLAHIRTLHFRFTVTSQHPASWAQHLLAPIYNDGKVPPLDRLPPKNYRVLQLADAVPIVFQMGLLDSLSDYVSQHNLFTSAQGACLSGRQPFDTFYTLLSYIQHRHEHQRQPTFVSFGDISLAFPLVFREQLLLRLHAHGITNDIWQHLRTLHHSICVHVLHGHNPPTSYINILKGLTQAGLLCPLLWGLPPPSRPGILHRHTTLRRRLRTACLNSGPAPRSHATYPNLVRKQPSGLSLARSSPPLFKSSRKSTPSTTSVPLWTAESPSTSSAHSSYSVSGTHTICSWHSHHMLAVARKLVPGHPSTTAQPPPSTICGEPPSQCMP
jgi:hypothetical protein